MELLDVELLGVALLVVSATGFAVHGGAALGLGLLLPWLGRTCSEQRAVRSGARSAARRGTWWLLTSAVLAASLRGLPSDLPDAAPLWGVAALALLWAGGATVRVAGRPCRGWGRYAVWWLCGGSWLVTLGGAWAASGVLLWGTDRGVLVVSLPLTALAVTTVLAAHGVGYGTRHLTGLPLERARWMAGASGGGLLSLTTLVLAVLPVAAMARLPVSEYSVRPALAGTVGVVLLAVGAVTRWVGRSGTGR